MFEDFVKSLDDLETMLREVTPLDARLEILEKVKAEYEVWKNLSVCLFCWGF